MTEPASASADDTDTATGSAGGPPGGPAPSRERMGLSTTVALGGLAGLAPLSMDMYLPALPDVTAEFGSSAATVQLTLTSCLVGMAVGQLAVGPMSDAWGRRRPLIIGMAVYVLATAACAFAPDAAQLIVFRLVQGLAGAAGIVIARAVVRDVYTGKAMARFFSTLLLISGAAPVVAPVIGGQILRFTDWRGVFAALTGIGAVLTLVVWRTVPETLPPARRHGGGFGEALSALRGLLADRVFIGYLLAGGFAFAALFAYVSGSSFVLQEAFGASPQTFGWIFGLNAVGLVTMGQINGKVLIGRVRLEGALGGGLVVVLIAAGALLVSATGIVGRTGLLPVAAALFVLMSAMGLTLPNTNALALMQASKSAGSASALLGSSQFLIGAAVSPLTGIGGGHSVLPMAWVQTGCAAVALGCFLLLCRPWPAPAATVA